MTILIQEQFETETTNTAQVNKLQKLENMISGGAASESEIQYVVTPLIKEVAELIAENAPAKFGSKSIKASTAMGPVICDYMLTADVVGAKANGKPKTNTLEAKYLGLATIAVEVLMNHTLSKEITDAKLTKVAVAIGQKVEENYKLHTFLGSNPQLGEKVVDLFLKDAKFGVHFALKTLHQFMTEKLGYVGPEAWESGKSWQLDDNSKYCKLGGWLIEQVLLAKDQWFTIQTQTGDKGFTYIDLGQHLADQIAEAKHNIVSNTFAKLPMLEEPMPWTNEVPGGYHLNGLAIDMPLITSKHGKTKAVASDTAKQAVNQAQSVAWVVNPQILEIANQLVAAEKSLGKLVVPTKKMTATQRIDAVRKGGAQLRTLDVANQFADAEAFFMPGMMDERGRIYQRNTLLNVQTSDFGKALLLFKDAAPVTDEAKKWLAIQVANTYGNKVDKMPITQKLGWVKAHKALISKVVQKTMTAINAWIKGTDTCPDEPWQFMAACFEYHAVVIAKSKETTNLPVAADATCSGVQVISALLKDEKAAALVNITPSTEGPADLYTACAEMAPQFIDEVIANFKKEETREKLTAAHVTAIKKLISGKGARKLAKPVVMTTPYSATASTQTDEVIAVAKEQGVKLTWLQGYTLTMALRKALYVVAPSMEIMEMVASEVAAMAKATGQTIIEWTSPSGHKVAQYKPAMKRVRVNAAGKALVMNQIQPGNNPSGHGSAAMPNFVHSLDSALLHKTFADVVVPFGLIHDSVLTRATDMDATLAHLKFTFVEIFSEDIFSKWAEEIGLQIDLESLQGDLDITQVMQSEYFFS